MRVGDDIEGAVAVAQAREAQGKVFDGAGKRGDFDHLADVVLVFEQDEDAVEDVFEERLRAQADADAENAGRREQRAYVDVEQLEDLDEGQKGEDAVSGGADDGDEGAQLGGAGDRAGLSETEQAVGDEVDDTLEKEKQKQDDEDLGQALADHDQDVLVPVALEHAERGLFDVVVGRGFKGGGKAGNQVKNDGSLSSTGDAGALQSAEK